MTLGSSAVHQVSAQARIIDRAYVLRGIVAQAMREARRARAGCFSLGGSPAFQRERARLRDADESATIGQSYSLQRPPIIRVDLLGRQIGLAAACSSWRSDDVHGTVVVAVITMRMMKTAVDEIVDVVAVRYSLMPAIGAVYMAGLMAAAVGRTLIRIFGADFDLMFVYVVAVRMMQVTIVEIVHVVTMLDCGVTATRAMLMFMVSMMRLIAGAHAYLLVCWPTPSLHSQGRFPAHRA
ncbi:hypothetical protein [Burkholderia multivorans]|uniref:hypothetical protein n=1 Tax=Burkholderia multivorans TaxID=87883 RepID=UPI0015E40499|nr:hypothetical protein [Burkholderia multivorans]